MAQAICNLCGNFIKKKKQYKAWLCKKCNKQLGRESR